MGSLATSPAEGVEADAPEPPEEAGTDIETLAAPYRRWHRAICEIKREADALAVREDVGGHLARGIVRLDVILEDARGFIHQHEPLEPCQKCDGEGCQRCARTGFWTRSIVQGLKRD